LGGTIRDNEEMRSVSLRFRADLRARWRSWSVLALIVGLFAGAVLTVAAGARRTDSAFARFDRTELAPDEMVFSPPNGGPVFAKLTTAQVSKLPNVALAASVVGYSVQDPADITVIAPKDSTLGTRMMRKKILAGRDVNPAHANEVTISFVLAESHHLQVGDKLRVDFQSTALNKAVPATFNIVGIDAAPSEFPPQLGEGTQTAWATPAFARQARSIDTFNGTAVKLRSGPKGGPQFEADVAKLAGDQVPELFSLASQNANTQHSIHLQAIALWILALLLTITALLIVGQLLARQSRLDATEFPTLRSLGMSTGELFAVGALRVVTIGAMGAAIAVVTAIAASPLLPVGLARIAEPRPGFAVDGRVFGLGVLATVAVVFLISVWSLVRDARPGDHRLRRRTTPPRWRAALGRTAAPSVALGTTFALESGQGRRSVPVRTTIIGAAVGLTALVAAFTFSTSLNQLLATPRAYGVTFDAYLTSLANGDVGPALPAVRAMPEVVSTDVGYAGIPLDINGRPVDGMAFASPQTSLAAPAPVHGRLATGRNEIMLGTRTMARLHLHVGQSVSVQLERGKAQPMKVVGSGVFPTLSDQLGLGSGALTTVGTLRGLVQQVPPPDHIFVRFRHGASPQAVAALAASVDHIGGVAVLPEQKPVDLVNFGRVQSLPLVLASILAALAALTMAHLLVTSINRHRTELAVLRAIGCVPRQVRRTVAVQATTLAALALLVGVPLGLLAGRWIWHVFATGLGISAQASTSVLALAILIPATIVVANAMSYWPGRSASRGPVAAILRTE
jgi:ABC-type lipoprotein release transport system permease subunit